MSEEATIRRGVRNARYTTLPNHVFEDIRLSMEARWLLGYLLSKPDNWTVRMGDIAKKGACGRDKARRMINELVEHGYAEKDQQRDEGRFAKLSLVIFDEPKEQREINDEGASVAFLPQTENPSTVNPSTGKPAPVNAALVSTENLAIPESQFERERGRDGEEETTSSDVDAPEGLTKRAEALFFRSFKTWDRFDVSPKRPMLAAWERLTWSQMQAAADAVPRFLAGKKAAGMKYAPAIASYLDLDERLWEAFPPVAEVLPEIVDAPVFGPVWGALRHREFGLVAPVEGPPPSAFMAEQLKRADEAGEQARRTRRAAHGWPKVNHMHSQALSRKGVSVRRVVAERLKPLMEPVMVGSSVYDAWRDVHEAKGWPWIPDPGTHPVVYFPVGGPEALAAFEQAIRDEGNGDDGGTRQQAAE